jgi:uncharacterized membrane protein YjdF
MFKTLWPARLIISATLLIELLGAANILPIRPEFTWFGMILQSSVALLMFELLGWFIRKHKINYPVGLAALLFAILIVADASGDMAHLYSQFEWYDALLHFLGGFATAVLTAGFMIAVHDLKRPTKTRMIEVFLGSTSLSVMAQVLYEMEEYYEDLITGSHRLGDGFDTVNDLSLALYGALLASALVLWLQKRARGR